MTPILTHTLRKQKICNPSLLVLSQTKTTFLAIWMKKKKKVMALKLLTMTKLIPKYIGVCQHPGITI